MNPEDYTGFYVPCFNEEVPVLMTKESTGDTFVMIFSSEEEALEFCKKTGQTVHHIERIGNAQKFFEIAVEKKVRVGVNPQLVNGGMKIFEPLLGEN